MSKSREEVISDYTPRMAEWLKYAYDEGYKNGNIIKRKYLKNLRSECHREAGENDGEYPKEWGDYTTFYGWCSKCKKPHSGRWAHVWDFCPWCGAKINHDVEPPYPTGMRSTPTVLMEVQAMCADINPAEIKSHGTDQSLAGWCGAWKNKMEKLIKHIIDGID